MTTRLAVHLERQAGSAIVGHLLDLDRRIYFEYEPAFLRSGLELSPFKLPLRGGVFGDGVPEFLGLYGLFFDSLPDGWGMLLMHRRMRQRGIDPDRISALQMLRHMGTRAMGALTFHPADASLESAPRAVELESLANEAQAVFEGSATQILPELELAGGSPGGARPKVVVAVGPHDQMVAGSASAAEGFEHWLVKFAAREDARDAGPLEETYARLARKAGISFPPTRLFEVGDKRVFAVKRFDRIGQTRVHIHTLGGLLHANHRLPSLDYLAYLQATRALTMQQPQVLEAFRRTVFNALACNRDDHARNFAYQMADDGQWTLAPAYDLTYSEGIGGYHTTSFAGEALRPTRAHLLTLATDQTLEARLANEQIDQVAAAIGTFEKTARSLRVSASTIGKVAKRLASIRKDFDHPTGRRKPRKTRQSG